MLLPAVFILPIITAVSAAVLSAVFIKVRRYYKQFKKKSSLYLMHFALFMDVTVILFGLTPVMFWLGFEIPIYIMTSLGLVGSIATDYVLVEFGNYISRLDGKRNTVLLVAAVCISVIIMLPQNYWGYITVFRSPEFPLRPFTQIIIGIYTAVCIERAGKGIKKAVERISEPFLAETYRWIAKGIKAMWGYIPAIIISWIKLFIPDTPCPFLQVYIPDILYTFSILIGVGTGTISSVYMYIGVTLPRKFVYGLYNKYTPDWLENAVNAEEMEKIRKQIEKLRDLIGN